MEIEKIISEIKPGDKKRIHDALNYIHLHLDVIPESRKQEVFDEISKATGYSWDTVNFIINPMYYHSHRHGEKY